LPTLKQWRAEALGLGPTKFSNFTKTQSLDDPTMEDDALLVTFFSSLFSHSPTFFYKNWAVGCPSYHPHPPLHATALKNIEVN